MGKRITHAADLPEWFDTTKYGKALQLDARGWYEQLTVINLCYEITEELLELTDPDDFYGFIPVEFLSAVRGSPIFSYYSSRFEQPIDHPIQYQLEYPPGILGITAYDIGSIILEWEPKRQKEFLDWLEFKRVQHSSPKNHKLPRSRVPWLFKPLKGRYITPIEITPELPDQVLRQSFELFVSQQREKFDSCFLDKDKRANTFLEWYNCGLLQYLDLAIWSIQENTSITNKALARGIFPRNYDKGEENIRTTTKKHASTILGGGTKSGVSMRTLWAYARLEDFLESQESK